LRNDLEHLKELKNRSTQKYEIQRQVEYKAK